MTAPVFVDTNVLIYAMDEADRGKQQAARRWRAALWKARLGRTSFQVLEEFYAKVTKKWPAARDQARAEVRDLMAWRPLRVDGEIIERAWRIQDRYQLSFWDALIVAAAKSASCRYLLTEDLQPDQNLDGVRVVNPFLCAPDSIAGD
ncbi:MAG: PIN domain-containing protein [Acidobacteriia bacterium]|nr:PIN domain-containing protein [Terriglobia bacterium]